MKKREIAKKNMERVFKDAKKSLHNIEQSKESKDTGLKEVLDNMENDVQIEVENIKTTVKDILMSARTWSATTLYVAFLASSLVPFSIPLIIVATLAYAGFIIGSRYIGLGKRILAKFGLMVD